MAIANNAEGCALPRLLATSIAGAAALTAWNSAQAAGEVMARCFVQAAFEGRINVTLIRARCRPGILYYAAVFAAARAASPIRKAECPALFASLLAQRNRIVAAALAAVATARSAEHGANQNNGD
jgi:hypothetical protein